MKPDEKERLFALIKEHGSAEALKVVLKRHKQGAADKSIRTSGEFGKFDELLRQLRQAHNENKVSEQELLDLLVECEENGGQHIFYFLPRDKDARKLLNDGDRIELAVFEGGTAQSLGLPKFYLNPTGYEWSDFRQEKRAASQYFNWTLKLYCGVYRTELIDSSEREEQENGTGVTYIVRTFKRYPSREIVIAKWHSLGFLELRLPCHKSVSAKSLRDDLASLKKLIFDTKGLGNFDDLLEPADLKKVMGGLVDNAAKRKDEYFLNNIAAADDDHGTIEMKLADDEDDVLSSSIRREILKKIDSFGKLVVFWKGSVERPNFPESLRLQFCCNFPNEIRVGAHTNAEAIEYVTRRLHELGF